MIKQLLKLFCNLINSLIDLMKNILNLFIEIKIYNSESINFVFANAYNLMFHHLLNLFFQQIISVAFKNKDSKISIDNLSKLIIKTKNYMLIFVIYLDLNNKLYFIQDIILLIYQLLKCHNQI